MKNGEIAVNYRLKGQYGKLLHPLRTVSGN
jgi:hypothetical protein